MGLVKLMKMPPDEVVEKKDLVRLARAGYFEHFLPGVTEQIAYEFAFMVFDWHYENLGETHFFPMDMHELEDAFDGNPRVDYWQELGGMMLEKAEMDGYPPNAVKAHSLFVPLALAEGRFTNAIISSFMLHYLCLGGDVKPMTPEGGGVFTSHDFSCYQDAMTLLRMVVVDLLGDPEYVLKAHYKKILNGGDRDAES